MPKPPIRKGAGLGSISGGKLPRASALATVAGPATPSTLVLYDTTGPWGWLGELYAIMVANLASHFGTWTALPVASYSSGMLSSHSAAVYIGSTYGEPLPNAFLDDVVTTTTPVIWAYDNIWQLTARYPNFVSKYGWNWSGFDLSSVAAVNYKSQQLKRYAANGSGIMNYATVASSVTVLASAVRSDNTTFPWALRSGNLTYIGENPLLYTTEGDRYLIFCDLLFDALAPATPTQHRALLRLEAVSPISGNIYAIANFIQAADWLFSQGVPFGFLVIPQYLDPNGAHNNGVPVSSALSGRTEIISAIQYMQSKGGTMMLNGYTHQYSNIANPYDAVTGDDCEFYRVTQNPDLTLNYLGPLPPDSQAWAQGRFTAAQQELAASGLPNATIHSFPNYAASAPDYLVASATFAARAERALYFKGLLSGGPIDYSRMVGQYFSYTVQDVYGGKVLADGLGGFRASADIIADAQRSLVVRDGVASFSYLFGQLPDIQASVTGLKNLGYSFVAPTSL